MTAPEDRPAPKPRTRRGFGRIEKRPSGRFRAAYIGPDALLHRAPVTFLAKDDAIAWLSARRAEITMNVWAPEVAGRAASRRTVPTLREFGDRWLNARKTRGRSLRPTTRQQYRMILDSHIYPTFGDRPIDQITRDDVNAWYGTVAVGRETLRSHAYSLLRTLFASALEELPHLSRNPVHIRGAGNVTRAHRIQPASLSELETIVLALPPRYRLMALLAAWCAMRFGELTELRRGDLDLRTCRVRIRRGVVRVGGEYLVGLPKSDAGIRDVAIPPHLMTQVNAHLDNFTGPSSDALLFPAANDADTHMAPSSLYKVFYPARRAAGRDDLRWHDLRHTGAVLAAQTGATLAELMARLGHSTPDAAMRYQHASANRDLEIARRLSQLAGHPPDDTGPTGACI